MPQPLSISCRSHGNKASALTLVGFCPQDPLELHPGTKRFSGTRPLTPGKQWGTSTQGTSLSSGGRTVTAQGGAGEWEGHILSGMYCVTSFGCAGLMEEVGLGAGGLYSDHFLGLGVLWFSQPSPPTPSSSYH